MEEDCNMRKNRTVILSTCIIVILITYSFFANMTKTKTDLYMSIAKEIYRVETALKEVDEDWKRKSITKVTPYTYVDSKENTIVYYYCNTKYFETEFDEITGLNTSVIGQVIDLTSIEDRQECLVNSWSAIQCELDGRAYLCWTISPEVSCIIEYTPGSIAEEDIFRIAESVKPQSE